MRYSVLLQDTKEREEIGEAASNYIRAHDLFIEKKHRLPQERLLKLLILQGVRGKITFISYG